MHAVFGLEGLFSVCTWICGIPRLSRWDKKPQGCGNRATYQRQKRVRRSGKAQLKGLRYMARSQFHAITMLVGAGVIFAFAILLTLECTPRADTGRHGFDHSAEATRIPPQDEYSPATDPGLPPTFVTMGDQRSSDCIVSDVSATVESGGWRWTYREPTLKFYLPRYQKQRFVMDFFISETTFKDTGPVTLSVYVNRRFLTRLHCIRPGSYHLDEPVAAAWLQWANPVIVQAVLDKIWVAPADGARLGYALEGAGFLES